MNLVLGFDKGIDWVARGRVKSMLCALVVERRNFLVLIPGKLTIDVMDDAIHCVEVLLPVSDLNGDLFGDHVHEHPVKVGLRDVLSMEPAQALPFPQVALKL